MIIYNDAHHNNWKSKNFTTLMNDFRRHEFNTAGYFLWVHICNPALPEILSETRNAPCENAMHPGMNFITNALHS